MGRTALLGALLVAYAGVLGAARGIGTVTDSSFDPLAKRPRAVEQLIVARRYADALPLALSLRDSYPSEPLVLFWLATSYSGLERWQAAADAWEQFVRASPAPADACPALPEAFERLGLADRAKEAYARCAGSGDER